MSRRNSNASFGTGGAMSKTLSTTSRTSRGVSSRGMSRRSSNSDATLSRRISVSSIPSRGSRHNLRAPFSQFSHSFPLFLLLRSTFLVCSYSFSFLSPFGCPVSLRFDLTSRLQQLTEAMVEACGSLVGNDREVHYIVLHCI